jgi:RNA polymerase sigma factor (sigma-70 family)
MATERDARRVGRHEGEHLRRFLAARAEGDAAAMRRWWEELVIDFNDRMDGLVYLAHRGRLDPDEHQSAVALAMARFSLRLVETFEGVSIGELVEACKTLAVRICIDVQRASIRHREREGRSIDVGWDADAEDRSMSRWETDEAADRFDRVQRGAEVEDFLDRALSELPADQRRVVELTFHGATIPEIMDELGITQANAYQLRSRGMRQLKTLKEQYAA